jgi:hypothetical protein
MIGKSLLFVNSLGKTPMKKRYFSGFTNNHLVNRQQAFAIHMQVNNILGDLILCY